MKINSEIKSKFMETENNLRVQIEELKALVKKNSFLQKKIEELEKEKENYVDIMERSQRKRK